MKCVFNILLLACILTGSIACRQEAATDHAHNADGSHQTSDALQSLSYTLYTGQSELFVEFAPLIVGKTSKFAAHLTQLGDRFLPYTSGSVTISFIQGTKGIRHKADTIASAGIFRLALQPTQPGWGKLIFDIQTPSFTDRFVIDSVQAFASEAAAIAAQKPEAGGSDISFLKEQAWKVEFANEQVQSATLYETIRATGEILTAPGDEQTIAAQSNGLVKFIAAGLVPGTEVSAGQTLFMVSGGEIPFENIDAAKEAASAEMQTARQEFDRATKLIADKLITQSEYQQAKLRLEQAQIAFNNLGRNYVAGGKSSSSKIGGFLRQLLVSDGQYVTLGQPLATVSKNQQLLLKAEVSLKDAAKLTAVREANFKLPQSNKLYNTAMLGGRLSAIGKNTAANGPFIPVYFSIKGQPDLLPGSFAEVFLKTTPLPATLVIPMSALIEEQGIFSVYVQTKGESFQKRELKLGSSDGDKIQVLSGLYPSERIVTKGAYQIKLAQASGTMPAHGHEH